MGITEPPDRGNPYPEGAEPYEAPEPEEGHEIDVVEVEYVEDGRRGVAPFVAAVGAGIVASMVYEGGKYVIKEAYKAGTREPVSNPRPPTVYSAQTGLTYRLEGGGYVPVGPVQMQ